MDPSVDGSGGAPTQPIPIPVVGGRSPGVSQQAPLSVLRGGSATSPIYISSGESYSSSSGKSDSSADVVGGSQQNRYRPLSAQISSKSSSSFHLFFTQLTSPHGSRNSESDSPPVLTYDLSRVRGPTPPIAMQDGTPCATVPFGTLPSYGTVYSSVSFD